MNFYGYVSSLMAEKCPHRWKLCLAAATGSVIRNTKQRVGGDGDQYKHFAAAEAAAHYFPQII